MEDVIIGTGIVLQIQLDPIGELHMEDMDFECKLSVFDKSFVVKKDNMTRESADSYILCLNTEKMNPGELRMRIHVLVPDGRFDGGVRDEFMDVATNVILRK